MKKWLLVIFLIITFHICAFIGFLIGKFKYDNNLNKYSIKALRSSQSSLINPLLDYEIDSNLYTKTLQIFDNDIKKIVDEDIKQNKANEIAVYFRSLNNGPWFGIKQDDNFFPASLLKVPLMIAYYKWAEEDPKILEKEITYSQDTFESLGNFNNGQYFKTANPIEVGKTYTVNELIEKMIVASDNNAKNLLTLNLDKPERLFQVYTDLGLASQPELKSEENILSVHEYSTFLRVLYNASYLDKNYSQKALELLTKTDFKEGLVTKLPSNITVAHKFGEYEDSSGQFKQLHDCGIVYYPGYPYLICVMTRGQNFDNLTHVLQDISWNVYQEIDKQIKRGEN